MRNRSLTFLSTAFICFAIPLISQAKESAPDLEKQKSSTADFQVTSLQFDNQHKEIANRFGQLQLIVTGKNKTGGLDRSHTQCEISNQILQIELKSMSGGIVTPLTAGKVTIIATVQRMVKQTTGQFTVADMSAMAPGFYHHVMPLLSEV